MSHPNATASSPSPIQSTPTAFADELGAMVDGFAKTQLVYVAVRLGIVDALRDGSRSATELALVTESNEPSLYRLLRALATLDIVAELPARKFALTPTGELLLSDVPGSLRLAALWAATEYIAWGNLCHAVKTGESAFQRAFGVPFFDWLGANPEHGLIFNEFMTELSIQHAPAIVEAYDFSRANTVVDVGGGEGYLLHALLESYPRLSGVLFDLPSVIESAQDLWRSSAMGSRCRLVSGDFLQAVPSGGDTYLLKYILHDWDDERAAAILRNCRLVLPSFGRILVVDGIVPEDNTPSLSKLADVNMMLVLGGRERTAREFESLFAQTGFRLKEIIATKMGLSIVEGVPV